MKKLVSVSIITLLMTACGTDEANNVDRSVSYWKSEDGLMCERRNDTKVTLCYDESGKIVKVDDPNGVLTLYERNGVDTVN